MLEKGPNTNPHSNAFDLKSYLKPTTVAGAQIFLNQINNDKLHKMFVLLFTTNYCVNKIDLNTMR